MDHEKQEQVTNALTQAARYMHHFESHSDKIPVHSANIYQFFAKEMQDAANSRELCPMVRALAQEYPTLRELMENTVLNDLLTHNPQENCPTLMALLGRLMKKETKR